MKKLLLVLSLIGLSVNQVQAGFENPFNLISDWYTNLSKNQKFALKGVAAATILGLGFTADPKSPFGLSITKLSAITGATLAGLTGIYHMRKIKNNYDQHKLDSAHFLVDKENNESKSVTIFIHGTLFPATLIPGVKTIIRKLDVKDGMHHALDPQYAIFHGPIPKILNKQAPHEFPIENFYFFGWSGDLSHVARVKAAQDLYAEIKKIKEKDVNKKITLIGHSHGGTIALLTAQEAQKQNDKNYVIDKAILLAMPVQTATENLAHDTGIFKQVFVNYSNGDLVQCIDPQGLYKYSPPGTPFFSKRTLTPAAHIKQAAILNNNWKPAHLSFAFDSYITNMPKIIKIMQNMDENTKTINITAKGPELLDL